MHPAEAQGATAHEGAVRRAPLTELRGGAWGASSFQWKSFYSGNLSRKMEVSS